MDKRLSLALLLSAVILVGWSLSPWGRPKPRPASPVPAVSPGTPLPAQAGNAGASEVVSAPAESRSRPAPVGDVVAETEEREEVLFFGRAGEPGGYRARFSNRGARLVDLRLGGYYRRVGLSETEMQDPENWVRLLIPEVGREDARTSGGSLVLAASASSQELAPDPLEQALWTMRVLRAADGSPAGVEFIYAPGTGVRFEKRVTHVPGSYELQLELAITNEKAGPGGRRQFVLEPAAWMPEELGDSFYPEPRVVAAGRREQTAVLLEVGPDTRAEALAGSLDVPTPVLYTGVHNRYFAVLLRGADAAAQQSLASARFQRVTVPARAAAAGEPAWSAGAALQYLRPIVDLQLVLPDPGRSERWTYRIYAGPKDKDVIAKDFPEHELLLDQDLSGMCFVPTGGVGKVLLAILNFLGRLTGNWGVAIIVLTLIVRLALFPINRRYQTSMARYSKKMKRFQPKVEELKKKYEKDPQKLRTEQAKLMQAEGAFPPLAGCLLMFPQMIIFLGLFNALRIAFDLRQAPFALWMDDLSRPDRMFALNLTIPLLVTTLHVAHFNLLPLLMIGLQFVQQLTMPRPTDPQSQQMFKMMLIMPVFFGFFLYSYAAGLSLYYITNSALGILEQTLIKKLWPIDDREPEKKKSGCGPFSGTMKRLMEQQQAQMKSIQGQKKRR